jgi:hypothetical protein
MLRRVIWQNFTDVLEVLAASIIRAISTHHPDDGGNFYQSTRRNIPEDSHLHLAVTASVLWFI